MPEAANSRHLLPNYPFWQRSRQVQTDSHLWLDRPTDAPEASAGSTRRSGPRRSGCWTHWHGTTSDLVVSVNAAQERQSCNT